ncbi:MAG TPA: hypothetical protein PK829_03270, partial [Promineifilum sp.]|nr:hypothetical protein [Promineifilum sp.]
MRRIVYRLWKPACLGVLLALLAGGVSFLAAAPAEPEASYKLSSDGPLPIGGQVNNFLISPNGAYTVYWAGQDITEIAQLYATRTDGSGVPVRLSALPQAGQYIEGYNISPDNARVVYIADQDTRNVIELYSAPLNGSAAAVKLNRPLVAGGSLPDNSSSFQISPNSRRVVYRADGDTDEISELYSVPIDGSAAAVKLNGPLVAGGEVYQFAITPDGASVVFTADKNTGNVIELYRVPIDGSAAPVKLSGALVAGGGVFDFKLSPDSLFAVYRADASTNDVMELYSVLLDGSAMPVKLNGPLAPGGEVAFGGTYVISPDNERVIYLADQDTNDVDELYSVPINGGLVVKLNPPLVPGGDVEWYPVPQISPDSSRVVYAADQETNDVYETFSAPLAGGGMSVKLNGPLTGNYADDFAISPDSGRVVYRALQDSATQYELYSVPLAGGAPVKLNSPLGGTGQVNDFTVSPDSSRVVYMASQDAASGSELYRVPLAGGAASKVNGALPPGGAVSNYDISRA